MKRFPEITLRQVLHEQPDTFAALLLISLKKHQDRLSFLTSEILAIEDADLDAYVIQFSDDEFQLDVFKKT